MDIRYNPDDPAGLWENITPVTPAEFLAAAQPEAEDDEAAEAVARAWMLGE